MKFSKEFRFIILIILFLYFLILIAINPVQLIKKSRNARRWGDVNNISTAVYTYITDNSKIPEGLSEKIQQIGTAETGCSEACPGAEDKCLDLSEILRSCLSYMPFDINATEERTGYVISRDSNEILTVQSCLAEQGMKIWVAR